MSLMQTIDSLPELFFLLTARATLLLAAAWIATRLLARSSAALRHRVWSLTLAGQLLLPLLSWWLPGWQLPLLPARSWDESSHAAVEEAVPPPVRAEIGSELGADGSPAWSDPIPEQNPSALSPADMTGITSPLPAKAAGPAHWGLRPLVGIWMAGAILSLCRILVGLRQVRRLAQHSVRNDDESWRGSLALLRARLGLERSVELRESSQSIVPLT